MASFKRIFQNINDKRDNVTNTFGAKGGAMLPVSNIDAKLTFPTLSYCTKSELVNIKQKRTSLSMGISCHTFSTAVPFMRSGCVRC